MARREGSKAEENRMAGEEKGKSTRLNEDYLLGLLEAILIFYLKKATSANPFLGPDSQSTHTQDFKCMPQLFTFCVYEGIHASNGLLPTPRLQQAAGPATSGSLAGKRGKMPAGTGKELEGRDDFFPGSQPQP